MVIGRHSCCADTTERRLLNQAFFERIEIDTEEIADHALSEPFGQIATLVRLDSRRPPNAARATCKGRTPAASSKDGGSYLNAVVELSGALLNPRLQLELRRLARLREQLAERETAPARLDRPLRRRQGSILEAVTNVLEQAGRPLRVRDVHASVEELLGAPIPFSSVNEALSTHRWTRPALPSRALWGLRAPFTSGRLGRPRRPGRKGAGFEPSLSPP